MTEKELKIEPTESDIEKLKLLTELLESELDLENQNLIKKLVNVVESYRKKSTNGLINIYIEDLECSIGTYENKFRDFRTIKELSSQQIKEHFLKVFKIFLSNEKFIKPERLNETYNRWIYFQEEKVEVKTIINDNWNFILYQSVETNELYLNVVFEQSFASWSNDFLIEKKQERKILSMIESKKIDRNYLNKIADKIRKEYFKKRK